MPNLNGEKTIERSILSFVNNNYVNKELLIIDGKSVDRSFSIIRKYANKFSNINWIKKKDIGISDAINIGIEYCRGNIIGYLGSDDLLNSETFFKINDYKSLVDFDAIYFDSYTYFLRSEKIILRKCPNINFDKKNLIKHGTIVGLQNIFFDKRVYQNIRYDVKNLYSMDYEIYFKIIDFFPRFIYVEYPATINLFGTNISYRLERVQNNEAISVMWENFNFLYLKFLPIKRILINSIKKLF
jgi:glycosyltransferase involved in cell wall biosynthesis